MVHVSPVVRGVPPATQALNHPLSRPGGLLVGVAEVLDSIQKNLLQRATDFRDANTRAIDSKDEFYAFFTPKDPAKPEIHGGFALTHWDGSRGVEEQIKNDLKVTIRCIPFDDAANPPEAGTCPFTGNPSPRPIFWARSMNSSTSAPSDVPRPCPMATTQSLII